MTRLNRMGLAASAALAGLTLLFFWKILLTNLILVGVDTFFYFYPYKAYAAEALRSGRLPLWNPDLFMGAPLLANSQVGLFYPLSWPLVWLDAPHQVAWSIGVHVALAGLFTLALARRSLGLSWPGAALAASLFAFGGYVGAQVEHVNQLNAAVWLPLLFLLYDAGLRWHRWRHFLLLALVLALTLLAGHAQTVFISLVGLGLYGLWYAVGRGAGERGSRGAGEQRSESANERTSEWRMRTGGPIAFAMIRNSKFKIQNSKFLILPLFRALVPLAAAALLAGALAAVQLLPTAELSALSIRSGGLTYREAVSFSLRPTVLHYSLLPPLGLDLSQVLGEAFGEWVAYLGVSGLALAGLGCLAAFGRPAARPFVLLAGSGLGLSLGLYSGPLYLALYYLVPGFALFRVPARWLLLYAFGMAILAGFGLDGLRDPAVLVPPWRWLRARPRRLALAAGLPVFVLAALIVNKTPPLITLLAWLALAALVAGLLYLIFRPSPYALHSTLRVYLLPLVIAELFWAAQALNYNQPTAPQAYTSLRNAPAFLLAADPPDQAGPPGRFLSLSGINYDPGDLGELEQIYGDRLSAKGLYHLIVAAKAKEVLFYNLPMLYSLHSVDGYDGGILPLASFIDWQRLFLPADRLSLDGRLREQLRFVPPGRLLSLLNTRWIITDKVFDVWIDDIFYDLQFPARLTAGQSVATTAIPDFPATAVGLVSHLEGGASLPDEAPVAEVTFRLADGRAETVTLTAGRDTAEGQYMAGAAHSQARVGVAWPYAAGGVDYISVYTLTSRVPIIAVDLAARLPAGTFVLRGLSLIHQPTRTSRSVLLTTEGDYRQVHSGDVKIYENRAVLPRAFIVHQAEVVATTDAALELMRGPAFNPAETMVRLARPAEQTGRLVTGWPGSQDEVTFTSYQPERVELAADLASPGWLVLADTFYPGWQVSVDGRPADILPANILFRAVAVPAGQHTLVFEFRPRSFSLGLWITALAVLGLIAGLAATRDLKFAPSEAG